MAKKDKLWTTAKDNTRKPEPPMTGTGYVRKGADAIKDYKKRQQAEIDKILKDM